MNPSAPNPGQTGNHLLDSLTPADFKLIKSSLVHLDLPRGLTLIEANTPIKQVFFPARGMVSLVQLLDDGTQVEVGIVGKEGMIGSAVLLGVHRTPVEAMVQIAGTAWRLPAERLSEIATTNTRFRERLLRFSHALYIHAAQSAACNARHRLEQRLARWLLLARDHVESNELQLSHEFLAIMLGTRRAGVTEGLAKFRKRGLAENGRGRIRIINQRGLEEMSCECYRSVINETKRLLA